jgi:hypothetical protein
MPCSRTAVLNLWGMTPQGRNGQGPEEEPIKFLSGTEKSFACQGGNEQLEKFLGRHTDKKVKTAVLEESFITRLSNQCSLELFL